MGWARLDDGFHDHPKLVGLPLEAIGLFTVCLTWAHRHRGAATGVLGHIPTDLPQRFAGRRGPRLAAMLEERRLWDREQQIGGWVIHDFSEYLPAVDRPATAGDVRRARSEAGKRGARARWGGKTDATATPRGRQDDGKLLSDVDGKPMPPTRPVPTTEPKGSAQTLVAEWIDHCRQRPPGRVIGQISQEVGTMLNEGIPYTDVQAGLAAWHRKGLHPSTLASVVHETRNPRPTQNRPSTTDQRVNGALALAARLEAEERPDLKQVDP